MSRYILIRRLRGPAFLLLVGVIALMAQAHILSWGESWPLFLILAGALLLAERAALAAEGYPPYPGQAPGCGPGYPASYPGAPYSAATDPLAGAAPPQPPQAPGSAIVPANRDVDLDREGGQR